MRFVRSLELPPGRYQLRVAAREAEEGRQGSVFYDIEVPDYRVQEHGMSGVLVTSRQAAEALTASMDERVEQRFAAPPTATRAFAANDVVTAYAEVYGEPEPVRVVTLTTRLTRSDGVLVFHSSEERASPELASAGRLAYRVDVPLRELPPGAYVLQIEARPSTGEPAAARSLAFEIAPRAAGAPAVEIAASGAGSSTHPASRISRVEVWLRAIEEHEPGSADAPARMVRSWTPEELKQLATDLSLVVKLIEDPKYPILWLKDPERPARFFRAPYSTDDDARLRSAARAASLHCGPDPGDGAGRDKQAVRCALNRMLKRGAVLHADAAIRVEADRTPTGTGDTTHWQVRFRDGRQVAAEGAPGHWELARSLLENVTPSPERDDTVRLWYIATSAQGQLYERQTRQEDQAVEMFPADPHVLFLAACLHETFASPMLQSLVRSVHVSGSRTGIEPTKSELKSAEKLFRRALQAEPGFVEARVRLGRVLYLLGQAEEAARALREAVATLLAQPASSDAPDTRLQLYLAEMFYGAAEEQLGQRDRAKASYTRAAELYPAAPSPRLALSQLALSGNEHALALEAVEHALLAPAGARERDDPWWRYHDLQGRDAAAWFARLYQSLADGM
jgi:tetratricopeptide (TPR) repeat protein